MTPGRPDHNGSVKRTPAVVRPRTEAENKVWHAHPAWFIEANPIVGYSKLKSCVRLLFWSGQSVEDMRLSPEKAAEKRYTAVDQVDTSELRSWLAKARDIQWGYNNLVRRKGKLQRLQQDTVRTFGERVDLLPAMVVLGTISRLSRTWGGLRGIRHT
jgi:hypothetical protein